MFGTTKKYIFDIGLSVNLIKSFWVSYTYCT